MRIVILVFILIAVNITTYSNNVVVNYQGKQYYITVDSKNINDTIQTEVWLRKSLDASSLDDIYLFRISGFSGGFDEWRAAICKSKDFVDNGETVLGCLSIVGSAFCTISVIGTDGATAFICETTWQYTFDKGAADCLVGVTDIIAKEIGKENEWDIFKKLWQLKSTDLQGILSETLDYMCQEMKQQ